MNRTEILSTAADLINGDRQADYGPPAVNFGRVAVRWSQIVGVDLTAAQVALMLADLKIARAIVSPGKADSYVDGSGYLALAGELAGSE